MAVWLLGVPTGTHGLDKAQLTQPVNLPVNPPVNIAERMARDSERDRVPNGPVDIVESTFRMGLSILLNGLARDGELGGVG